MKFARGDLWSFEKTHWIAVPVNQGYKANGRAIMGAGVAQQAAKRWPHLRLVWGEECQRAARGYAKTKVYAGTGVLIEALSKTIMVPTKGFDPKAPELSWKLPSTLRLVEESTAYLRLACDVKAVRPVALPLLGCGYGGLDRDDVVPILERLLNDHFTLVEQ